MMFMVSYQAIQPGFFSLLCEVFVTIDLLEMNVQSECK